MCLRRGSREQFLALRVPGLVVCRASAEESRSGVAVALRPKCCGHMVEAVLVLPQRQRWGTVRIVSGEALGELGSDDGSERADVCERRSLLVSLERSLHRL